MTKRFFRLKRLGLLLLFICVSALFSTRKAAAQENPAQPAIQQMRLQILPEYDDPRVLVIAQGRLDVVGGDYNGPVTFRLPAAAQINQMAVLELDLGGPQFQPYDTRPDPADSAWQLVTYTLTNPHFFYEYYYELPGGGSQKQFSFTLNSLEAVGILSVEVQQPLKAENFTLEPEAATARNDPAGFTYWQFPDRAVAKGETVELMVRYTKSDPNPSVVRQTEPISVSGDVGSAVTPEVTSPPGWVGFTVIGAALVLGAGFLRYRLRPQSKSSPSEIGLPATSRTAPGTAAVSQSVVSQSSVDPIPLPNFCTECGQTLPTQSRFCPHCGKG